MTNLDEFRQRLEDFISTQVSAPVTVHAMQPLAGGASRDSWLLEVHLADRIEKLVLRRDLEIPLFEEALERHEEFHLLHSAFAYGVKVPRPRWVCADSEPLGKPFFLMDYVEGISIGRKVVSTPELEHARRLLPEQMAQELAKIHAISLNAEVKEFLPVPAATQSPAQKALADTYRTVDKLQVHNPAIEYGLRWLERHAPACDHPTLVHGDYRVGNFLVGTEGLNAIIDWEFAHIGDPCEDLAWGCLRDWRFGNAHLHLGGIAAREPFISAYERYSGRTVDRRRVDYWEVMGNMRWAVTCLWQARRHLSGQDPSVEFASLGRRSAEMQIEFLRLIEQKGL